MAEFLTTQGTAFYLERVISEASERLILVSPFLKLSRILAERLRDADRRGVPMTLVYGKEELKAEERTTLAQLVHCDPYFLPNLHAKCYAKERHMVITSMSMYDFSEKPNREIGVLLAAEEPAFQVAEKELKSIIDAAERREFRAASASTRQAGRGDSPALGRAGKQSPGGCLQKPGRLELGGHCIRCRIEVTRNGARPLCRDCYEVWVQFGNSDYPERYCHACGREADTSMARPLCDVCFYGAGSFGCSIR